MSSIGRRVWCAGCCAAVEAVVREASATGIGALLGGGAGLALHAGTGARPSAGAAIAKAAVGALLGHLVESALVPAAQSLVCRNCGCSSLSALST